jgi:hypothetical protein
MGPLTEALCGWFLQTQVVHEVVEQGGHTFVRFPFHGRHGEVVALARAREDARQILVYGLLPLRCPVARRGAMAVLVTRANYGMVIGNLEMDFDDGELRYKTSVDLGAAPFQAELVQHLVWANVLTLDRYAPAIQAVIAGEVPEIALARIEEAEGA